MASLSRPDGKIYKINPHRGFCFTSTELFTLLGPNYKSVKLPSDDWLLTQESPGPTKNDYASFLSKGEVFGTAIIIADQELPK